MQRRSFLAGLLAATVLPSTLTANVLGHKAIMPIVEYGYKNMLVILPNEIRVYDKSGRLRVRVGCLI